MQFPDRLTCLFLLILNFAVSQSIESAYGLGLNKSSLHTSTIGSGGAGLIPTFHQGASIDNISSWPNLGSTFISVSYETQSSSYEQSAKSSIYSGISGLQFIAPFKARFAFGISLKPANTINTRLMTDTVSITYNNIPLKSSKFFSAGGGIIKGSIGISMPLSQRFGMGIAISNYFGSSRDEQSIYVEPYNYRLFNIRSFEGVTYSIDMSGNIFSNQGRNLTLFSKILFTPKPINAILYTFDMYEDRNNNFAFDAADYPNELDVDTTSLDDIYSPFELGLGFTYNFNEFLYAFSEYQSFKDFGNNININSIFKDKINNHHQFSMGFLRFGNPNSNSWQDKLIFRFGINQTKYQYYLSQSNLIENSISFGFGFKFGLIGNQIDLSYRFGNREGLNLKETIQNLNISISLGDIWFLKRRN